MKERKHRGQLALAPNESINMLKIAAAIYPDSRDGACRNKGDYWSRGSAWGKRRCAMLHRGQGDGNRLHFRHALTRLQNNLGSEEIRVFLAGLESIWAGNDGDW